MEATLPKEITQHDRLKFKRRVYNIMSSLGIMGHVKVYDQCGDFNHIYIESSYAMACDFYLKYSEQYNVFHLYIYTKGRGQDEKENNGYTIAVIDSSLAACDIVNVIETLHRRRPGRKGTKS